jgi:hypothetical protein
MPPSTSPPTTTPPGGITISHPSRSAPKYTVTVTVMVGVKVKEQPGLSVVEGERNRVRGERMRGRDEHHNPPASLIQLTPYFSRLPARWRITSTASIHGGGDHAATSLADHHSHWAGLNIPPHPGCLRIHSVNGNGPVASPITVVSGNNRSITCSVLAIKACHYAERATSACTPEVLTRLIWFQMTL